MERVISRLETLFDPARWLMAVVNFLPDLVVAAVTATAFWLLWRLLAKAITLVFGRAQADLTATAFVLAVARYGLGTIALVTVLGQVGINTGSLIASLGVAGLTIGFAARDALSNVISGLFIFWDRPFVIGDLVEVDGRYGRVEVITMRSTRLVTPDGKMLAIPNSTVVNTPVASYTNFPHLRLDVSINIGVNEDLGRVRTLMLSALEDTGGWMTEPAPVVLMRNAGDYNLEMELRVWLADERGHIAARAALLEAVYERLRAAGIDMPYETIQLQPLKVSAAA